MRVGERDFTVIIEAGDDGYLIGSVPELPGCHTQGKGKKQLLERMREAIELYLSVTEQPVEQKDPVVGVERVRVKLRHGKPVSAYAV